MKIKIITGIFCFTLLLLALTESCKQPVTSSMEQQVKAYYTEKANLLLQQLDSLTAAVNTKQPVTALQNTFAASRFTYKHIEAITEYYFQGLTKRINGPALPDVKTEDGVVWPPHGFQVIEQFLYADYSPANNDTLVAETKQLQTDIRFTITNMQEFAISQKHLQELLQHQIIRIATLGITGFDAPLSKLSLPEAVKSLTGIKEILPATKNNEVNRLLDNCIDYLINNPDFDSFNRMAFILQQLSPLSSAIESSLPNSELPGEQKPFEGGLHKLIKGNAFNADYYVNYAIGKTNPAKVALGKALFYENRLSASGKISCGSCHQPGLYFTDGKKMADNFVHGGSLQRNTPTLLYAALQANQFYDLRSTSLEDQVNEVMNNGNEFNLSAGGSIKKIALDKNYTQLFKQAYGNKDTISSYTIRNAIAAYIRSLSPFSTDFDAYLGGDTTKLTAGQVNGFNLFMGKAKCGTCHFFPLFNGTVPPWYNKTESEIIGVPQTAVWRSAMIDGDSGRYKINPFAELLYAFKTPTVRNAAVTAPYMHNGVYTKLDEVVEFYSRGGGVGLGMDLPFQTLPFDSLQLNTIEKKALVDFMRGLTDKKPVYL